MSDTLIVIIAVLAVLVVGFLVFRSTANKVQLPEEKEEEAAERLERVAERAEEIASPPPPPPAEPTPTEPEPEPVPAPAEEPAEDVSAPAEPTEPAAPTEAPSTADDLTKIKGLGPKNAARLEEAGVTRFEQIAAWSESDIEAIAARTGRPDLADRAARDRWVEQAGLLARGETAAFEEKFGKLG